jgi:Ca-activated chloride channel family protein
MQRVSMRLAGTLSGLFLMAALTWGTFNDPNFWSTAVQRGDRLMEAGDYGKAAEVYSDPWRIGIAQYRDGNFKEAASTFARVPGANGAYDAGNALLMHGDYEGAIDSYNRALGFHAGWQEAIDNKALAAARKQRIDDAGEDRDQESAGAYKPDETVVDQKGDDKASKPLDMNSQDLSDTDLRATWLRQVQTTPGDFLRAKFAYQAAQEARPADDDAGEPTGGNGGAP